jgi:hypothetical protein
VGGAPVVGARCLAKSDPPATLRALCFPFHFLSFDAVRAPGSASSVAHCNPASTPRCRGIVRWFVSTTDEAVGFGVPLVTLRLNFPTRQFLRFRPFLSPFTLSIEHPLRANSCARQLHVFCFPGSSRVARFPPIKQPLALGAEASRSLGAPITRAKNGDRNNVRKSRRTDGLFGEEPRK